MRSLTSILPKKIQVRTSIFDSTSIHVNCLYIFFIIFFNFLFIYLFILFFIVFYCLFVCLFFLHLAQHNYYDFEKIKGFTCICVLFNLRLMAVVS